MWARPDPGKWSHWCAFDRGRRALSGENVTASRGAALTKGLSGAKPPRKCVDMKNHLICRNFAIDWLIWALYDSEFLENDGERHISRKK